MAKTYKNGKTKTRRNRKTNSNRRRYKKGGEDVSREEECTNRLANRDASVHYSCYNDKMLNHYYGEKKDSKKEAIKSYMRACTSVPYFKVSPWVYTKGKLKDRTREEKTRDSTPNQDAWQTDRSHCLD